MVQPLEQPSLGSGCEPRVGMNVRQHVIELYNILKISFNYCMCDSEGRVCMRTGVRVPTEYSGVMRFSTSGVTGGFKLPDVDAQN